MTIDNVFTYTQSTAAIIGTIGTVVGILILLALFVLWICDLASIKIAIIAFSCAILSITLTPAIANAVDQNKNIPNKDRAVEIWLEETYGLTLIAGSAPGKDATGGLLEQRVVIAIDADGNRHTIQLLPLDRNLITIINKEPINPAGSWYLADPETGQEFTLENTTEQDPNK